MTQGRKLTIFIDDYLYKINQGINGQYEGIIARMSWETSVAVEIEFLHVYSRHGDYLEDSIGNTYLRKGKNMYKDYINAKEDWIDTVLEYGWRIEFPDLDENEFNKVIGRKQNSTKSESVTSIKNEILLLV